MKEAIKKRLKKIAFIYKTYSNVNLAYQKYFFKKDPKLLANMAYRKFFKKNIDWKNPKDIIEKTIWQQFNADTSTWTKLSDKYLVREYVAEVGESRLLNKLYGHYYSVNEINFKELPDKFVIKSNNASGTVLLVKDKKSLDIEDTKNLLNKWLSEPYGIINAQLHYLKIKPCIIIEEFLSNNKNEPLIDYKFYCFHGIADSVLVCYGRDINTHDYQLKLYNTKWEDISYNVNKFVGTNPVEKPMSFDIMLEACKKLGNDIPFVRIDFYEVGGKPYFGEMTFTMGFGSLKKEFYNYLGSKLFFK